MKINKLRIVMSVLLAAALAITAATPAAALETGEAAAANVVVSAFAPLEVEISRQTYDEGSAAIILPDTLTAEIDGQTADVPVTWAAYPAFNGNIPGEYVFSAILPESYKPVAGVEVPAIYVTITEKQSSKVITAFIPLEQEITRQTYETGTAVIVLPDVLAVEIGGQAAAVPVTWEATPSFDNVVPNEYVFSAILPEGYAAAAGVQAPVIYVTITETVSIKVITAFTPLEQEIALQTYEAGAAAVILPDFLAVEIDGQAADVPATWAATPPFDGYVPDVYVFSAILPEGYETAAEVETPTIELTIIETRPIFVITAFEQLEEGVASQIYEAGAAALILSDVLTVEVGGQTADVPVIWAANPTFDGEVPDVYVFSAILPDGYVPAAGTTVPVITVEIKAQGLTMTIAGTGTEQDPIQITNGQQLAEIAALVKNGGYFGSVKAAEAWLTLMNDIDLTGLGDTDGWLPIGTYANPFTGSFIGNCKTITGLYLNRNDSHQGLFGVIGAGGMVKDIYLADVSVTGYEAVGGVAGSVSAGGAIENSGLSGRVTGITCVGGVAGYVYGSVNNCYSLGAVTGDRYVGGVAGHVYGTINNCYSVGDVSGNEYTGGVAGAVDGTLSHCYSAGAVSGSSYAGGVTGYLSNGRVDNCVALNPFIRGSVRVGRVAGINVNGFLENNAAFIGISDSDGYLIASDAATGLNGADAFKQDINTAAFFQEKLNFDNNWLCENNKLPILFATDGELLNGQTVKMPDHLRLVTTDTEPFIGDGTEQYPFEIWTATDLALLAQLVNSEEKYDNGARYYAEASYKLMNNIDLSTYGADWDNSGVGVNYMQTGTGTGWIPIGRHESSGNDAFTGEFDGNNHIVTGLYINRSADYFQGLFGCISGGTVKNLSVIGCNVTGYNFIGCLSGYVHNNGIVQSCYTAGNVTGNWYIGGLVGNVDNGAFHDCRTSVNVTGDWFIGGLAGLVDKGIVQNSAATGNVTGDGYVGGLAGFVDGSSFDNSYTTSNVTGNWCVGGLAGIVDSGSIQNSYATGNVTGDWYVGGMAGLIFENSTIQSSASSNPSVIGNEHVGTTVGFVGL